MIICFDLTKRKTFDSVKAWITSVNKNCEENIATLLVGNKCDLEDERVVSREEAEVLAAENNLQYFETSAKSGTNVNASFIEMIDLIFQNKFANAGQAPVPDAQRGTIKLGRKSESAATQNKAQGKDKKGCCK